MKRNKNIAVIILLIAGLAGISFLPKPYSMITITGLTVAVLLYAAHLHRKLVNSTFEGEFILRRQRKPVRFIFVVLAILQSVACFVNHRFPLALVISWWLLVIFDIYITILTRQFKPVVFIINGSILRWNNPQETTRDLARLSGLTLHGFTNELRLSFAGQGTVYLRRNDYNPSDLEQFISICVEKSQENLFVSPNLKNEEEPKMIGIK